MKTAAIILTSLAITTAANAECPAAMPLSIPPGEVWRGPITITEPDAYPLTFVLSEGAALHGGRKGLRMLLKMCDGQAELEVLP